MTQSKDAASSRSSTESPGPESPGPETPGDDPVFEPVDDKFHFGQASDAWWETETCWFSFHHAERRLGGWLYTMARPNIGTIAGGIWVWDDTASLPWEVPYSANYSALEIPADQDLDDIVLPTGVSISVIEPTMSYRLGFEDPDRLSVDLRFEGSMAPRPLTAGGSTFGKARHFDQIGRVSGQISVAGESIDIDCWAMRDRTWGPRPENRPRQAAYVTAAKDGENGFLAVTNAKTGDRVAYGFLRQDGRTVSLVDGTRTVAERDPEHGWVTELRLEVIDAEGRQLEAVGEPVSRIIINRHTFIDINSLVRWSVGGDSWWGEDQDMWPMHTWSKARRTGEL